MKLPQILILTETAVAPDLAEALSGLQSVACRPEQLSHIASDVLLLFDLEQTPVEQACCWLDEVRQQQPHLPVVLILGSGDFPPEELLQRPMELIWRPLRATELALRLQLLTQRTPRSSVAEGFRRVFEKHHAMMLLINPESGQIVDANPAASRFYGYSRETLRGMLIQQINQLDPADVAQEITRARQQLSNYFTFVHKLASGELRNVEVHSTPVEIEGQSLLFSILHDITSRSRAEEALRQSEAQYRLLFEIAPIGIGVTDQQGHLLAFNDAMLKAGGYSREQVSASTLVEGFYLDAQERQVVLERFGQEGFIDRHELRLRRQDGSLYYALLTLAPIHFGGQPCMLALLEDITERKLKDERIQTALNEREILLREIHHRVKNNFQVIISLLNMQSRKLRNPQAVDPLIQMRNRIRSMALIHEQMYLSDNLADVDFSEYLQYLTRELYSFSGPLAEQIQLSFDLEEVLLDIDQAIPCGLLVNELLTNAFKYAFPPEWEGERQIDVLLHLEGESVLLQVADNGVGLPAEIDPDQPQSLGLQLIRQLVRQLSGEVQLTRPGGTCWTIRFRH